MKVCAHCRLAKPLSEYYITKKKLKSGKIKEHPRYICKVCDRKAKRARDKRTPDQRANTHLLNKYGITLEQKLQMIRDQGCKCQMCPVPITPEEHSKGHVDHCHETGFVRGILCSNCNRGIGHLKHDVSILISAIQYLVRAKRQELIQQQQDPMGTGDCFSRASLLDQDLLGLEHLPRLGQHGFGYQ